MSVNFYKNRLCLVLFLFPLLFMISCEKREGGRIEIEYALCEEEELPDKLVQIIETRKENAFQLVYENAAYRYLVVGHGKQNREDSMVSVRELYEEADKIVLDTILLSSSEKGKNKSGMAGLCPYIVIRCSLTEKPVVFR